MPEIGNFKQLPSGLFSNNTPSSDTSYDQDFAEQMSPYEKERFRPIIIDSAHKSPNFDESDEEEDVPQTMDEIEKEAIKRALTKYKGRRKEAADELHISERTLYRKIKQYDL